MTSRSGRGRGETAQPATRAARNNRIGSKQRWTKDDIHELLNHLETHLPVTNDDWLQVAILYYSDYAVPRNRSERSAPACSQQFQKLLKGASTGAGADTELQERAHSINARIQGVVDVAIAYDDPDEEDEYVDDPLSSVNDNELLSPPDNLFRSPRNILRSSSEVSLNEFDAPSQDLSSSHDEFESINDSDHSQYSDILRQSDGIVTSRMERTGRRGYQQILGTIGRHDSPLTVQSKRRQSTEISFESIFMYMEHQRQEEHKLLLMKQEEKERNRRIKKAEEERIRREEHERQDRIRKEEREERERERKEENERRERERKDEIRARREELLMMIELMKSNK
jgi:hypothetical protein